MLTRESYSLNKPSTRMSAKKAHPTREIHHQTIGALGFCCFFFCRVCATLVSCWCFIVYILDYKYYTKGFVLFYFFCRATCNRNMALCLSGCVPPNRYTNRKCVNAAFFWSIIFFLQSISFSTHTRHINATTHRQLWQPLTHSLYTHLICVLLLL